MPTPYGNMFGIGSQGNLDAARIGFHAAFLEALEAQGPDPLEALFTEVSSSTTVEEWEWLGDIPGFQEWKGDRKLGTTGAEKMRIVNKDWASGIRVHQNNIKDDKLGIYAPRITGMAQKARRHRSDLMVKMLLNGFAGTAYPDVGNGLGYDGAFFFSNSHSSASGPSQGNLQAGALTAPNLEAARLKMDTLHTADGSDPLDIRPTTLIVGPALIATAQRLMTQDFVATAAGTATESNLHKGQYTILESRRITGTYANYWFLAALDEPVKPCIFQLREEIQQSSIVGEMGGSNDSEPRFKNGELWFGAEARYNVGYFAWQTIIGSPGT